MGNTCTKEFTLSSILQNNTVGPNQATKYRKTELTGVSNGSGTNSENSVVKESQVKFAIIHPQVRDILSRLSYEEIQILLNIFRLKVRIHRSLPKPSDSTSPDPSTDYSWKRLSLPKSYLFDIFRSIHGDSLSRSWQSLEKQFQLTRLKCAPIVSERLSSSLISKDNLLRMFLFSDYKNGVHQSSSAEFPQEIIFQDFCTIASIFLHGSKEDIFSLLFLLFAEEIVVGKKDAQAQQARRPSVKGVAPTTTNTTATNNNNHVRSSVTLEADHAIVLGSQSQSADPVRSGEPSLPPSSQTSEDPPSIELPPPSLAANHPPAQQRSSLRDLFLGAREETTRRLVVTERRLADLFLFVAAMLHHEDSTSFLQKRSLSKNGEFGRLVAALRDEDAWIAAALTSSSSAADSRSLSLSAFLQAIFVASSPERAADPHLGRLLASLNVSRVLATNIFQPMVFDLVPNPYQIVKKTLDLFETSDSIGAWRSSMRSFQQAVRQADPRARDELLGQSFDLFLVDANWLRTFCEKMELRPSFSELGPSYLVTDLLPLPEPAASKFELFDLFTPSTLDGDSSDLLRTAMALPLLDNRRLLSEGLPGALDFLPPDQLRPCADFFSSTAEGQPGQGQEYCVLPFEVGRALYEFFDLSARHLPATTFRRTFRYLYNTASQQLIGKQAELTASVSLFVNNFATAFSCFLDVHRPFSLPVYLATRHGLPTPRPIESAFSFRDDLPEDATVSQLLAALLRRYGQLSPAAASSSQLEPLEAVCRLWALVPNQSVGGRTLEQFQTRMPFGPRFSWVLVTEREADYQADCHGLLWDLHPAARLPAHGHGPSSSLRPESDPPAKEVLAVLLENINADQRWPTDNLLAAEFWKNINVLAALDPPSPLPNPNPSSSNNPNPSNNKSAASGSLTPTASSSSHVLKIGLRLDVLSDQLVWRPGEVAAISKLDALNDLSSLRRNILLTIRLLDPATNPSNPSSSPSSGGAGAELIDLPLESPRLLVAGTLTDGLSLSGPPPLDCADNLRAEAVRTVQRSSLFEEVVGRSVLSAQQQQHQQQRPSSTAVEEEPQPPAPHSEAGVVPATPNSKVFRSSVVPITVAFTPEPHAHGQGDWASTPRKDQLGHEGEAVAGSRGPQTPREVIAELSGRDLDEMDLDLLAALAAEAEGLRLFFGLRWAEHFFARQLATGRQLAIACGASAALDSLPAQSPAALMYLPRHMKRLSEAAATSRPDSQQNGQPAVFSPGKQLLSQWERLFPGQSGQSTANGGGLSGLGRSSNNLAAEHQLETASVASSQSQAVQQQPPPLTLQLPAHAHSHGQQQEAAESIGTAKGGEVVRRIGIMGLNNLGNTCFLSSALQCLLRAPVFLPYFLSFQYRWDVNERSRFGSKGRLTEEFAEFVRTVYSPLLRQQQLQQTAAGSGPAKDKAGGGYFGRQRSAFFGGGQSTTQQQQTAQAQQAGEGHGQRLRNLHAHDLARVAVSPIGLFRTFQQLKSQFSGADQQDAQEFLAELLDTFHEDLKNNLAPAPAPAPAVAADHPQPPSNPNPSSNPSSSNNNEQQAATPQRNLVYQQSGRGPLLRLSVDAGSLSLASPSLRDIGADPHEPNGQATSAAANNREIVAAGQRSWEEYIGRNDSIVSNVFQGQLCTHVLCLTCGRASTRFEPFTTLSLPIPKAAPGSAGSSALAVAGAQAEAVTVVVRLYRKLPRLAVYWKLRHYLAATAASHGLSPEEVSSLLQWPNLAELLERRRETKRFVLRLPRSTTAEALKLRCIDFLRSNFFPLEGDDLDDEAELEAEQEDGQTRSHPRRTSRDEPFPEAAHRELRPQNLTVVDVSPDERHRIRKIIENKETLGAVLEESGNSSGELELLVLENNKDIGLISALPGNKLAVSAEAFYRSWPPTSSLPLLSADTLQRKAADLRALLGRLLTGYLEEDEYADGNLFHQWHLHLHPANPTNPNPSSPAHSTAQLLPERLICDLDYRFKPAPSSSSSAEAGSSSSKGRSRSSSGGHQLRPFPKQLADFQLLDRLDALDHKGQWYSGSVVEVLVLPQHPPAPVRKKSSSSAASQEREREQAAAAVAAETFLRIHFDNFSPYWDEWYDQADFAKGCLAPLYSRAGRKLKIYDIQLIQRRLVYQQAATANPNNPGNPNQGEHELVKLELIESPFLVQVESYRSVSHLFAQVAEQMLRFLSPAQVAALLAQSRGSLRESFEALPFPFEIRMLNIQNFYSPPTHPTNPNPSHAQHQQQQGKNNPNDRSKERFDRHKSWEGQPLPRFDRDRPVSNIYHPKLVLSVDWEFFLLPEQPTSPPPPTSLPTSPRTAATPSADLVLLSEYLAAARPAAFSACENAPDLSYDDDASFLDFDRAASAAAAASNNSAAGQANGHGPGDSDGLSWRAADYRRRNLDRRVFHLTAPATPAAVSSSQSVASSVAAAPNGPQSPPQQPHDPRPGLSIESVLSNFTAKEEVDYSCEHCKGPQKAAMFSSIHRAPDVLILHLKRLVMNSAGGAKIRTLVKFPLSDLDISQFMTQNMVLKAQAAQSQTAAGSLLPEAVDDQLLGPQVSAGAGAEAYDLFGVVNHLGGMFGGHYTAFAQCEDLTFPATSSPFPRPHHSNPSCSANPNESAAVWDVANQLRTAAFESAEVALQDYSLQNLLPARPLPAPTACGTGPDGRPVSVGGFLNAQAAPASLESTYRWYKFDDDYAVELTAQHGPVEPVIVSESAYLLFYKKKNLSRESILRYT